MVPDFGGAVITVCKWGVIGLICGGIVFWLISGWLERELAAWEAVVGVFAALALLGLAIKLSDTLWSLVLLAGVIAVGAVLFRYMPELTGKKRVRQMMQADIEMYEKALQFDPRNVAAHSFLGDKYIQLGQLDLAIEHYRKALELDPKLGSERKKLANALRERELQGGKVTLCERCQQPVPPGSDACPECGYTTTEKELASRWRSIPRAQARLVAAIGAGGVGLACIFWALKLASLAQLTVLALAIYLAISLQLLTKRK